MVSRASLVLLSEGASMEGGEGMATEVATPLPLLSAVVKAMVALVLFLAGLSIIACNIRRTPAHEADASVAVQPARLEPWQARVARGCCAL